MTGKTLKTARIALQAVAALSLTVSAAGLTWLWPAFQRIVEEIQIVTAVMSMAIVTFVSWLIVTLMLGRIYCSTVCPLGTFQDLCARVVRATPRRVQRFRYGYRRPATRMQYAILLAFVAALMAGVTFVLNLLDPATVYSNFVSEAICAPLGRWLGLPAAGKAAACSAAGIFVAWVLLVLVAFASGRTGRTICNTICPVGTTLGFVSRYSILQIDIDTDKCVHCNHCVDVCKAGCINPADSSVDGARCVDCFDCLTVCPNNAIHYTSSRKRLSDVMMQRIAKAGQSAAATINTSKNVAPTNKTQS